MRTPHLRARLRLYLVSPEGWGASPRDAEHLAALIQAGVGTVQFREKADHPERVERAARMRDIARAEGALFIVNDDPLLAQTLDADGVHVGTDDASVASARKILGPQKIVGASARTLERALAAQQDGADYLGVGAIFDARASKANAQHLGLDGFAALRAAPRLKDMPMVAIGGIRPETAPQCFGAGADGVAMIRGLWSLTSPDDALRALRNPSKPTP